MNEQLDFHSSKSDNFMAQLSLMNPDQQFEKHFSSFVEGTLTDKELLKEFFKVMFKVSTDALKNMKKAVHERISPSFQSHPYYFLVEYILYFREGDFLKLLELEELVPVFETIGDSYSAEYTKFNIGLAHRSMGNYEEAIIYYMEFLENADPKSPYAGIYISCFNQVAHIYFDLHQLEKAEEQLKQALAFAEKVENPPAYYRIILALGESAKKQGRLDEAEEYIQRAFQYAERKPIEDLTTSKGMYDFGELLLEKKEYGEAINYLKKSLDLRRKIKATDASITSLIALGRAYYSTGAYETSIQFLDEAIQTGQQIKQLPKLATAWKLKFEYQKEKGDWKNALESLEKLDVVNEEKEGTEQQQKLKMVENKIRIESTKMENAIIKAKNFEIQKQKELVEEKNVALKGALDEISQLRISRKSIFFSIITVVGLVILTEIFLDPIIEVQTNNAWLSLLAKVLIAFLLKPIESMYERILIKRALRS